jgi:hypothetical protein
MTAAAPCNHPAACWSDQLVLSCLCHRHSITAAVQQRRRPFCRLPASTPTRNTHAGRCVPVHPQERGRHDKGTASGARHALGGGALTCHRGEPPALVAEGPACFACSLGVPLGVPFASAHGRSAKSIESCTANEHAPALAEGPAFFPLFPLEEGGGRSEPKSWAAPQHALGWGIRHRSRLCFHWSRQSQHRCSRVTAAASRTHPNPRASLGVSLLLCHCDCCCS